jgi:hypothetical protein
MMTLAKLVARDGHLCGLCQKPVDLNLTFPHPCSATVGHIVPIERGGQDEPRNLRLEHLSCNRKKAFHLDSELSLPFTPPKPPDDVVALLYATARHRKGSQKGGREAGHIVNGAAYRAEPRYREIRVSANHNQSRAAKVRGGQEGARVVNDASHRADPKYREDRVRARHAGGSRATHVRWHVRRGIVNPNCVLCIAATTRR